MEGSTNPEGTPQASQAATPETAPVTTEGTTQAATTGNIEKPEGLLSKLGHRIIPSFHRVDRSKIPPRQDPEPSKP